MISSHPYPRLVRSIQRPFNSFANSQCFRNFRIVLLDLCDWYGRCWCWWPLSRLLRWQQVTIDTTTVTESTTMVTTAPQSTYLQISSNRWSHLVIQPNRPMLWFISDRLVTNIQPNPTQFISFTSTLNIKSMRSIIRPLLYQLTRYL